MTIRTRTLSVQKVLAVLLEDPSAEYYGLEIARAAGLKSGTLYPILARLEQAGWLTSGWENIDEAAEGRRRRRYYTMTPLGIRDAKAAREEALRDLRLGGRRLGGAV